MLSYDELKKNPKRLRAFTSLDEVEFERLIIPFGQAWALHIYQTQSEEQDRQRGYGGGRKATLATIKDKLLFSLVYQKIYPLQEVMGELFDLSQGQVNVWVHTLSPILKAALDRQAALPERDAQNLEETLADCDGIEFLIDGTERRCQRPTEPQDQADAYSGKKKTHTRKNNVIVDAHTCQIRYLSKTYPGSVSEKRIADQEAYVFPTNSLLTKDAGYQGYEPVGVITFQPKKKPYKQARPLEDRFVNTVISAIRVPVEHVLSGVKRCRIVKDVFRNSKANFDDLAMELACGLHNFRSLNRRSSLPAFDLHSYFQ